MDLNYSKEAEAFRRKFRHWAEANLPPQPSSERRYEFMRQACLAPSDFASRASRGNDEPFIAARSNPCNVEAGVLSSSGQ